jgi:L-gulonolactone oxidase
LITSWKNWAGTSTARPKKLLYPSSQAEIITIVEQCSVDNTPLKVVGAGHSYNDIFHTGKEGTLLSLEDFKEVEQIDDKTHQVTVQAGIRLPDLIRQIKAKGLSLSNLGTNVFDNIAGACSAGYHGSGIAYGIFVSQIVSMDVVIASGEVKTITNADPEFAAYAVGLGVLGVIVRLTIQCEPFFNMEVVEKKMAFSEIEAQFDDLLQNNEVFKFIWIPHTEDFMVWLGNRTSDPELSSLAQKIKSYFYNGVIINNLFHEALLFIASFKRSLVPKINHLMSRLLLPKEKSVSRWESQWAFFLPHFLKQDVVEYAFPIEDTFSVFKELIATIKAKNIYVDTPIEVRFVKEDNYWMSPSYGRNSCYIGTKIHFPYGRRPEYLEYFTEVDNLLLRYDGRPHWGKQFRITTQDFKKSFPNWDAFWKKADELDPQGIFRNDFTKRLLNS